MKEVYIAFDVDGTLIKNAHADRYKKRRTLDGAYPYDQGNMDIIDILVLLSRQKNVKIIVWSGGGKQYADNWVDRLQIREWVWKTGHKLDSSLPKPQVAFDDVKNFNLAEVNIIV